MAAIKEVRQRIRAVRGIQQVTRAMKMVAAVKMRRVEDRVVRTRPYVSALEEIAGRLAAGFSVGSFPHPLGRMDPGAASQAMVVMSSDSGLCGAFNVSVFRRVMAEADPASCRLILVGRKARNFFARRRFEVIKCYEKLPFPARWDDAERMAREITAVCTYHPVSTVKIVYQQYVSPGISRPRTVQWLPFVAPAGRPTEVKCEPSAEEVLDLVVPRTLTARLHQALLESQASEQGARMVAMDNATNNATELAEDLTLLANKLRQWSITKELLEITTGVEAMKA